MYYTISSERLVSSSWVSLSWSNCNLEILVFHERKKQSTLKKPRSKAKTNNKLDPHMTQGPRNRTRATFKKETLSPMLPSVNNSVFSVNSVHSQCKVINPSRVMFRKLNHEFCFVKCYFMLRYDPQYKIQLRL